MPIRIKVVYYLAFFGIFMHLQTSKILLKCSVPEGDLHCQCILSIFPAFLHQFYLNITFDPKKLSLEAETLSKWGVRLQNSSTKGGSASRFHQPDGGLPLEFINILPQNGCPPLGTISMDVFVNINPFFISTTNLHWHICVYGT